jgi:hypothetical protein
MNVSKEVVRWGMRYWLDERLGLRWEDLETGARGILTFSPDPSSDYARIRAELEEAR